MFCTYACQHECILNTHASRTMNRLPADVVAERAAANETREPAPGNPAARRPRSGSPRTPTAHQWQLMRDPTASFAGPQSPRAKILQSKAARGGGDTQRDLDLSCSAANVAWQAHVCVFFLRVIPVQIASALRHVRLAGKDNAAAQLQTASHKGCQKTTEKTQAQNHPITNILYTCVFTLHGFYLIL